MKEITICSKKLELAALTWGDENANPVIALHGWLDNAASFVPLAKQIKNMYFVSLDLPGHGKSEHHTGCNYHIIDYASDVLFAAEALGFKKFSLLGHSLGAIISCMIAAGVPDRINRIALIDCMGPVSSYPKYFQKRYQDHFKYLSTRTGKKKVYKSIKKAAKARYGARSIDKMQYKSAKLLVERALVETNGGYTWRSDPDLNVPSPMFWTEPYVLEMIKLIECETLFIKPDDGYMKHYYRNPKREKALQNLEILKIPGRHHIHLDDPKHVAPYLQSFFDRGVSH